MKKNISWLQLSDLHIFQSTDWNIMLDAYKELSKVVKPNFLIITGDYRHKKFNNNYDNSLAFLNEVVKIFGLRRNNVFLVPGNHDVNDFQYREDFLSKIRENIEKNPDFYLEYMNDDAKNLLNAFTEYSDFVREFYKSNVQDDRVNIPAESYCLNWKNKINIIVLNTALISEGNSDEKQIVDINKLSLFKSTNLPTIVLAHHSVDSLCDSHRKRLIAILNKLNVKAYFCGDEHKLGKRGIGNSKIPNTSIPQIICGKSAIEIGDSFSDLCVIEYECRNDGKAYVQVFRYEGTGFIQSSDFYYDVNKLYNFPLFNVDVKLEKSKIVNFKSKKGNTSNKAPISIWLPDAELAKGKQTRFNSFTNTSIIEKYFDNDSGYLGIASVKGIGKTFALQVKRIKSSRRFFCLPHFEKPSISNNWATERILFDAYDMFKTANIYDDLVILWKVSIYCYVISHLKNKNNENHIVKYITDRKVNDEIARLCFGGHNQKLSTIINNAISIPRWEDVARKNCIKLNNLCMNIINIRREENPGSKPVAIFIDKIDQAVRQTNAEPPADCVVCPKSNNYSECKSKKKSPKYCGEESGCQSKNCCYGCEIFADNNSGKGLRIYENSNAAKRIHVNIWQYIQLALMDAAGQIIDDFNGEINVFYTLREEAFNCEETRLGEQNQKIASRVLHLSYTVEDQEKIFLDCIRNQDPTFLYKPEVKDVMGMEEIAFVGVSKLCHPYCLDANGNNQSESIFSSIYRHSFDRSRDIQRYGEFLTKNINIIRKCNDEHEREELVKQKIEDLAASLAYCSKQSESTANPSYYTEKMRYLPNYWANNDNFEYLLSLIDRNFLFEDDIKRICRTINKKDICPQTGCKEGGCKHHPFSVLYNMGYLGYIVQNSNNSTNEIQRFLDASEICYFIERDDLMSVERVAYIIHPALTKTIEKKYNKSFMHFTGFILGKGISVETKLLKQILDDKRVLSQADFLLKYYFKP